ncbi:unnamed protein product [Musa acuminata subsp. malaccensis]|uniref:(wild Malaysian banana) hypothetical protein n=1 Tax=Musa acuminata subsp. malaccensis TaxID=214687 RepID=A0A804I1K9_MUSAM|nr:unnamed protein product [Musa acuminata subsp. malaccensis]
MLPTSEVIHKSTFPTNISLHKWCGHHNVLAPADSLRLFRTKILHLGWEESVSDSLPCKVGKVFDASLKYSIHEENRGGKNKRKQETHICCCKLSPIPYICKLKLLSESYVCADLPLHLEIALKPPLTAERAWLVWLKSFHSKGQEWSVAPLALDVILCSRSTWQGLANSPLAG